MLPPHGCLCTVLQVGPALQELGRLEETFWELQQAVGSSHAAEAASHADSVAAAAEAAAEGLLSGADGDAEQSAAMDGAAAHVAAAGLNGMGQNGAPELKTNASEVAAEGVGGASSAQDDLALHLSLSMLFTCATRVRSGFGAGCPGRPCDCCMLVATACARLSVPTVELLQTVLPRAR